MKNHNSPIGPSGTNDITPISMDKLVSAGMSPADFAKLDMNDDCAVFQEIFNQGRTEERYHGIWTLLNTYDYLRISVFLLSLFALLRLIF
eukprot:COSAG05_NODE_1134_length_5765_cov_73.147017_3_plen_90_part_00